MIMDKIFINSVKNVSGIKAEIKNVSLGKFSTILAPNSFGKTSLANLIEKQSLDDTHIGEIDFGIIKSNNTIKDLNVMLFNKNTIINSILTKNSRISVGYELQKRKDLNDGIEEITGKVSSSKRIISDLLGGGNGNTVAKICGIKANNMNEVIFKLYENNEILPRNNPEIESDLKNIYNDFQNGIDRILEKTYSTNKGENTICFTIDESLKKSIIKYINEMKEASCDLPSSCPICGSPFDSWDNLLSSLNDGLQFTSDQTEDIKNLIETKFSSKILNKLKIGLIHEIIDRGGEVSAKEELNNIKRTIQKILLFHLNAYSVGDMIEKLSQMKNSLKSIERHNLSMTQLESIKNDFAEKLRLFNKTHIKVQITNDSEVEISFDDGNDATLLSESEKNLIAMIFFTNYIKYNNEESEKELLLVFDDPLDSYDENHFEEVSCMLNKIIDENYCIIFTHSLHALSSLSKADNYNNNFYYMYDNQGKAEICEIHQNELKALNKYGGDYGLCEYWYKDGSINKKNELILIGGSSILRNSVEFIKKFWNNSKHHNLDGCSNKLTNISNDIYISLCNKISHYRGSSSRIQSLKIEIEKIFGYSNKGNEISRYELLDNYRTMDNIIKDIMVNFDDYKTNRCFSNIVLKRFVQVLFIKRNLEFNLRIIARNNGVNMVSYSSKETLGGQVDLLINEIDSTSKGYSLLRDIEAYKQKYNNLINDFSHSSNRILPPFLLIRNHIIEESLNDLYSIADLGWI